MKDRQRPEVRRRRIRYPLGPALLVSALVHALLALFNPGMDGPPQRRSGGSQAGARAQFTILSLTESDGETRMAYEEVPAAAFERTTTFGRPGTVADPGAAGGRGLAPAEATVAERLRYNAMPFSDPVAPERESENQRALREARERVRRAGEELGPLPPAGVTPSRGGGAGIRIPFGFAPPPPAITVPAPPPPDSIVRRDSIRAAARAAARRDSIRAARDTTRLRGVAPRRPIILPPVPPPDTTRR